MTSPDSADSPSSGSSDDRDSSMTVNVTFSVGYTRKRPSTQDRLEQRMDAAGLFLAGAAVVIIVLIWILPKVFDWVASVL